MIIRNYTHSKIHNSWKKLPDKSTASDAMWCFERKRRQIIIFISGESTDWWDLIQSTHRLNTVDCSVKLKSLRSRRAENQHTNRDKTWELDEYKRHARVKWACFVYFENRISFFCIFCRLFNVSLLYWQDSWNCKIGDHEYYNNLHSTETRWKKKNNRSSIWLCRDFECFSWLFLCINKHKIDEVLKYTNLRMECTTQAKTTIKNSFLVKKKRGFIHTMKWKCVIY